MNVAVISDIHANRHALDAVLGDIDATGVSVKDATGRTQR